VVYAKFIELFLYISWLSADAEALGWGGVQVVGGCRHSASGVGGGCRQGTSGLACADDVCLYIPYSHIYIYIV